MPAYDFDHIDWMMGPDRSFSIYHEQFEPLSLGDDEMWDNDRILTKMVWIPSTNFDTVFEGGILAVGRTPDRYEIYNTHTREVTNCGRRNHLPICREMFHAAIGELKADVAEKLRIDMTDTKMSVMNNFFVVEWPNGTELVLSKTAGWKLEWNRETIDEYVFDFEDVREQLAEALSRPALSEEEKDEFRMAASSAP